MINTNLKEVRHKYLSSGKFNPTINQMKALALIEILTIHRQYSNNQLVVLVGVFPTYPTDEVTFKKVALCYNTPLERLTFKNSTVCIEPTIDRLKRRRKRKILRYNPPYSINMTTNMTRKFLKIIDTYCPHYYKH